MSVWGQGGGWPDIYAVAELALMGIQNTERGHLQMCSTTIVRVDPKVSVGKAVRGLASLRFMLLQNRLK